jgi:hypothetical protein
MNRNLRIKSIVLAAALALGGAAVAAEKGRKHDGEHARQAAIDHRLMAEAHLAAAQCLEAGKPEKDCHAQLAKDCKGLGIGKYCGMRHRH